MSHVFISYSRKDKEFVERLYADLIANGIAVWTDTYNINPGDNWRTAIEQAIETATALIIVLSRSSNKSEYVLRELNLADIMGIRTFPILIEDTVIPVNIQGIQYVDFRKDYQHAFSALLGGLKSGWNAKSSEPPPEESHFNQAKTTPEPQNKGYAFLSYISEDADFIERLKSFLKSRDYAFWDYRESERDYGLELYRELERQIEGASVFVSVLSDSWRETLWTARELVYAEEAKVPVFVLQAKPLKRPVPILINLRTRIDMYSDYDAGIIKLGDEFDKKGL